VVHHWVQRLTFPVEFDSEECNLLCKCDARHTAPWVILASLRFPSHKKADAAAARYS